MNCQASSKWHLISTFIKQNPDITIPYLREVAADFIEPKSFEIPHVNGTTCLQRQDYKVRKEQPSGTLILFCTEAVSHRRTIRNVDYLRLMHFIDAIETGDMAKIDMVLAEKGEIAYLCMPFTVSRCWNWEHVSLQPQAGNWVRDTYCFPGRKLCICNLPCLDNGSGARFVRNVAEVDERYGAWKPAADTGNCLTYEDPEPRLD